MTKLRSTWRLALLLLAAVLLPGATSAAPALGDSISTLTGPAAIAPGAALLPGTTAGVASITRGLADAAFLDVAPPVVRDTALVFQSAQVISIYGHPGVPVMGELGRQTPPDAAAEAARLATEWDALNGDRGAVGALHLIVDVAQPVPMRDGSYLERMSAEDIEPYAAAAREAGILLFLDLQLGMSDPLTEVQRLRPFLLEPNVHLALDPEFAMRASRGVPGVTIGSLSASEVNAVQDYLDELVRIYGLPPKVLVLHQFLAGMLTDTEALQDVP